MEMNIPGLVAIIIFYLIILAIGIYAARRQKKKLNSLSDGEFDVAVLAGRDIGLCVGCFTMTGMPHCTMVLNRLIRSIIRLHHG